LSRHASEQDDAKAGAGSWPDPCERKPGIPGSKVERMAETPDMLDTRDCTVLDIPNDVPDAKDRDA
jgi:hypothetical protein